MELNQQEAVRLQETMAPTSSATSRTSLEKNSDWSTEEVQLLVKAVNLFPAGTVRRWDTVATFINTHSGEGSKEKDAKMVISKVKTLQKLEADQKASLNKEAFTRFEQQHQSRDKGRGTIADQPQATPSERYGNGIVSVAHNVMLLLLLDTPKPWTADEQKVRRPVVQ